MNNWLFTATLLSDKTKLKVACDLWLFWTE